MPFAPVIAVLCTAVAAMGDWKPLNEAYGALPKAVSMGVIGCAVLCFCVRPDYPRARQAVSFFPLFMLLIAIFPLLTMSLWISNLAVMGSIWRSLQQISYQIIAILYVVSMVYLFGRRAIDYFFTALVLANGSIVLLEMLKHGFVESIQSVIDCCSSFGDITYGFMRAIEIHDITFLFGQLFIYYLCYASLEEPEQTGRNWSYAITCFLFVLMGFKRIIFLAMLPALVMRLFVRSKHVRFWLWLMGFGAVFLSFLYIYLIHSGTLVAFLMGKGIDLKGRETFWTVASSYFEFSIFWRGLGYEAVNALTNTWVETGVLSKAFPLHNDFLKVYLEIGAIGLALWTGIQYVFYPQYWAKKHFSNCALLYVAIILYMSVTYLTDNTAFYYWSSIGLRLIPAAYCYARISDSKAAAWQPPNTDDIISAVREMEMGHATDALSENDD